MDLKGVLDLKKRTSLQKKTSGQGHGERDFQIAGPKFWNQLQLETRN